jgi:phage regulator Rha-like protein
MQPTKEAAMADQTVPYLLSFMDGEPVASTRAIAAHAGLVHPSIYRLVITHQERLNRFGSVRFQIEPRASGKSKLGRRGGDQNMVAFLNEHQATLLLTMMRNSDRVLDLKELLVSEFFRMRNEIERLRMSLYQERNALAARAAASEAKGSFGGYLLRERRTEKSALDEEEAELALLMQPSLFGPH